MIRRLFALSLFALLATLVLPGGTAVRANGVPQLVKLTYLDGVSNFGPKDAEGVLEFSFAEAYARIDVKNLVPQNGFTYEGWMIGPEGKPFFVGDLPVNATGVGSFEAKLADLVGYDYNLFVVAGRPTGAAKGTIPETKSIAGRFVVITNNDSSKTTDVRPGLLPETGEQPDQGPGLGTRAGLTLLVMTVAAVGGFAIIRLFRRGGTDD